MILKATKRAGAADLARHLLKAENEHVDVHELRGFVSDALPGALNEAYAVSRGTRCQKFLFSLSLSPPAFARVTIADFEDAIDRIERKLGLEGQPRAIVFHEKEGRRHAHCVWSRIKVESMTAIDLPHFKMKLMDISRDLYLEHDWRLPPGMIDPAMRSPLSFNMSEWFKAKRAGQNPRDIKRVLRQCWEASDSSKALRSSLEQCGYFLAKGDRRAVVALDTQGEIYNLARWLGIRTKEVVSRVDVDGLPSTEEAKQTVTDLVSKKLQSFLTDVTSDFRTASAGTEAKRLKMVERHRAVRKLLEADHERREALEATERAERFRKGLLGLWDRVTGTHRKIRAQNEAEIQAAKTRDRAEKDRLIAEQLAERQELQFKIQHARRLQVHRISRILRDEPHTDRYVETRAEDAASRTRRPRSFDT